jgi:hypothetical protein
LKEKKKERKKEDKSNETIVSYSWNGISSESLEPHQR